MSIRVQNWVWEHSETTGNDRLVLLAIADEADDDGTNAYPSIERLASKVRVNRATILRSITRLEDLGELAVTRPEKYGRGRFNVYAVRMGRPPETSQTATIPFEHGEPREATKNGSERSQKGAETSRQVRPDPKTHRPQELQEPLGPVDVVMAAWRESTGKTRAVLDGKRQGLIERALKVLPLEDVVDATRGWKHSPFHRGENDRKIVYNELDLLLRDAGKIEQFRDWERGINRPTTKARPQPVGTTVDEDRTGQSGRIDL